MKYKILKFLDVIGFKVFDPVVRLAYGEEPRKQLAAIGKYLVIPILFLCVCVLAWKWIGPNHKTKSGEVPTPAVVWESAKINHAIAVREAQKSRDFQTFGEARQAAIDEVNEELTRKREEFARLEAQLQESREAFATRIESKIAPLQKAYNERKDEFRARRKERTENIRALSEQFARGEISEDLLLTAIRETDEWVDSERESLSAIKSRIDEARSIQSPELKELRRRADSLGDEIFFLTSRLEYLGDRNLEARLAEAKVQLDDYRAALAVAENPTEALKIAQSIMNHEKSIRRLDEQQYAKSATIYLYIKRSLFTVFIGFAMAAIVAIPVGILCGLNKVLMACFTPIIAIFKPVSPVVWLLIFQIVVGAFFPDPENHPLFVWAARMPLIGDLGINPALIFSACTVAMCALWPALVNTALGVSSVDPDHINVARVLQLGFFERLFKIIIPSALPLIFAGLRISMGVGWMVLIAAEALSSSDGLGKFVWDEYQNGSSLTFANIIFACFVIGIIGFFLDRIMIICQRLVSFDTAQGTTL